MIYNEVSDIPKWIQAKLSFVFGIDISRDNIENKLDGACARYLNYRRKFKIMPSALFVYGNSGVNIKNGDAMFTEKGNDMVRTIFSNFETVITNLTHKRCYEKNMENILN